MPQRCGWARAPDSSVPGESRMLEQPGQTKNIPVTKALGHEGPLKESNDSHQLTKGYSEWLKQRP